MALPVFLQSIHPAARLIAVVVCLVVLWPFYSVPTGSRGVVTQFGKIVGIEGGGLAVPAKPTSSL